MHDTELNPVPATFHIPNKDRSINLSVEENDKF